PHHRHGTFIAVLGGKAFDSMAAHPNRAALAVGMAQHRFRGDHAFQPIVHDRCPRMSLPRAPRSARSRAMAARKRSMPAPVRAEVAIRSGNAAGRLRTAALTSLTRSA